MPDEKVYRGRRDLKTGWVTEVTVNGRPLHNVDSLNSMGFEWGYGGAGPRALALSIMSDYFGVEDGKFWDFGRGKTVQLWQLCLMDFFDEVVKKFSRIDEQWELASEQIREWIKTKPYATHKGGCLLK